MAPRLRDSFVLTRKVIGVGLHGSVALDLPRSIYGDLLSLVLRLLTVFIMRMDRHRPCHQVRLSSWVVVGLTLMFRKFAVVQQWLLCALLAGSKLTK